MMLNPPPTWTDKGPASMRRRVRGARGPTSAGRRAPHRRTRGGSAAGPPELVLPLCGFPSEAPEIIGQRGQPEVLSVDDGERAGGKGAEAMAGRRRPRRPWLRSCRSHRRARRPAGRPATGRRAPRPAPRTRPAPTPGWPGWSRPACRSARRLRPGPGRATRPTAHSMRAATSAPATQCPRLGGEPGRGRRRSWWPRRWRRPPYPR